MTTVVPSVIQGLVIEAHDSRLGRYLDVRQGSQTLSIELSALPAFVAALCKEADNSLVIEIGERKIVAPGPLALPPGEYRLVVMDPERPDHVPGEEDSDA